VKRHLSLQGRLLIGEGENLSEVWSLELPSGKGGPVPGAQFGKSRFLQGMSPDSEGGAYVMVAQSVANPGFVGGATLEAGRGHLYHLPAGGVARRIGPPLHNAYLLDVRGGTAVASACGSPKDSGIFALDLHGGDRWRRVVPGNCSAALSPDHELVAYTRNGNREVWRSRIDGKGGGRLVVDVGEVRSLPSLGIHDARVSALAWGHGGVAVVVTKGHRGERGPYALVVVRPHHPPATIGLGAAWINSLAWQPGGDLLAFADFTLSGTRFFGSHPEGGDLRIYDARSGTLRQLAASPGDIGGVTWSPDGRTVAVEWNNANLMFVDVRSGAIQTRNVQALPLAWAAS
jgi:WD40 repeat protein